MVNSDKFNLTDFTVWICLNTSRMLTQTWKWNDFHHGKDTWSPFFVTLFCFKLYLTLRYNLNRVPLLPHSEVHFAILMGSRPKNCDINISSVYSTNLYWRWKWYQLQYYSTWLFVHKYIIVKFYQAYPEYCK